ncbi:MAG: hypothetical protein A3B70_05600 [Deltaproteobacteria bacterium RIFCSPHIGHO2_02_FULL_40_11]|nr:MAG: hypothetical protein A3B70_05600 [Deltaproteobacteria bacterium RIFCSPHIGHO2_02_FULL_40_11]
MLFEWDHQKNSLNCKKHRISFELAASIFDDPLHLSVPDEKRHAEERWITLGRSATGELLLVVIHTYKETLEHEIIRIISARKATKKEKKHYEEGI